MTFLKKAWPLVVVGVLAYVMLLAVDQASRTAFAAGVKASAPALLYVGYLVGGALMIFFYLGSLIAGAAGVIALGGLIWQRKSPMLWMMLVMASWLMCLYLALHETSVFRQMRESVSELVPHQSWVDMWWGVLAVYVPPGLGWGLWYIHEDNKKMERQKRERNQGSGSQIRKRPEGTPPFSSVYDGGPNS